MDLGRQVGKENRAKIDQKRQRKKHEDSGSSLDPLEASGGGGAQPRGTGVTASAPGPRFHLYNRLVCTCAFKTHGFLLCLDWDINITQISLWT